MTVPCSGITRARIDSGGAGFFALTYVSVGRTFDSVICVTKMRISPHFRVLFPFSIPFREQDPLDRSPLSLETDGRPE